MYLILFIINHHKNLEVFFRSTSRQRLSGKAIVPSQQEAAKMSEGPYRKDMTLQDRKCWFGNVPVACLPVYLTRRDTQHEGLRRSI